MAGSETTGAGAGATQTLGAVLRNARLARELTVEQVAAELRIEARQLTALEENRLEQIGVPVFVKGYLKQYGQRLGLDVRDLLALYHQQAELAEVQIRPNRTIKLRDERQISTWIVAALALLTIAVGFAAWWWNDRSFEFAQPSANATSSAPAARDGDAPASAPASPAPALPAAAPAELPATPSLENPPAALDAPEPPGAGADAGEPQAAASTAIPLRFTFTEESWAEVTDARGARLLFGLNAAGRRVVVRGEPPFAVVLGNADAVELLVDGESYPIPAARPQDGLARFSIDIVED